MHFAAIGAGILAAALLTPTPSIAASAMDVGVDLGPPPAAGQPRAAEEVAVDLAVDYRNPRTVIRHPGAPQVKVHFNSLRLAPGDYITVSSEDGREVHTYHSDPTRTTAPAADSSYTRHRSVGFAAMSISDDVAVIALHRTGGRTVPASALDRAGYGARVDRVWRNFSRAEYRTRNAGRLVGCRPKDGREPVACYADDPDFTVEVAKSAAVAALYNPAAHIIPYCTTARVGKKNRMLTAVHCGATDTTPHLKTSEVWFDFECRDCGDADPKVPFKVSVGQILKVGEAGTGSSDWAVFSLKEQDFPKVTKYGNLMLDDRMQLPAGERIYSPTHGQNDEVPDDQETNYKRLGIFQDPRGSGGDKPCVLTSARTPGPAWAAWSCDGSGLGSGGPIISRDSQKIVAILNRGECTGAPEPSFGIKAGYILQQTGDLIQGTA
ncbi:hypothetical protein GCM10010123_09590 [Pilimelia anulata]|uniref:Uncharacterized protein n=1 Tax=Pilimelia anulata TaxID=53371 RepID=A0A8J3B0B4_9ACTN|nr:hypothetical protein [Pilimelia anulata]GGJ81874.1 hypothetical protein GCM10010123_09590 [Pilimelia anulata]